MVKIFISYRRKDSPHQIALIYEHLKIKFGKENIFIDRTGILAGENWRDVLDRELESSNVLLVLIGPRWEYIINKRANNPEDFVRYEIMHGLKRGDTMRVIPVLIDNASQPQILPTSIQALLEKQFLMMR